MQQDRKCDFAKTYENIGEWVNVVWHAKRHEYIYMIFTMEWEEVNC